MGIRGDRTISLRVREATVFAVAAALAFWTLFHAVRTRWAPLPDIAGSADAVFADPRVLLRPGERVGVFLPPQGKDMETASWYAAQYALAPAIVHPIYLRECNGTRADGPCRPDGVGRFLLPQPDTGTLAFVERSFGLRRLGWSGRVVVLGRAAE